MNQRQAAKEMFDKKMRHLKGPMDWHIFKFAWDWAIAWHKEQEKVPLKTLKGRTEKIIIHSTDTKFCGDLIEWLNQQKVDEDSTTIQLGE